MKEFIDKLSRGVIEYSRPILEVSVNNIEITMDIGEKRKGEFLIKSSNGIPVKCVFYSTNECLKITNSQFVGVAGKIEYIINGAYLEEGTVINGNINIVSNGGEHSIPYTINTEAESARTNIGKIKNMFHFANFVQTNYDEALKLFTSNKFKNIFLSKDLHMISVYEGLMENENKESALEEFLIAANKKKRVTLSLSEYRKTYDHPDEIISDSFIITKDNWGYVYCTIECDCPFIQINKKVLTSDDFAGSNYEYIYLLRPERLHKGINYGKITISMNNLSEEKIEVIITADNSEEKETNREEYKKCRVGLYKEYLDFRMHKTDMGQWSQATLALIDKMRSIEDKEYFPKLLQAQIYISKKRESDASWLLENVAETLIEKRYQLPELYCYYLYVRTLQKKDRDFTEEMKKKVREFYDNGYDSWKILWVLLYMDESFDSNGSLKLARIKEQYSMGMHSGIMYFEAAMVFCEQPAMLRVLNDFEVQVMYFAVRNRLVTDKLAVQYAELAAKERNASKILLKTLMLLYDICDDEKVLSAIISILIRNGMCGEKYLVWYEKGIEKELKIAGIYENYLYSAGEDYTKPLPQLVLMYFNYNTDVANDRLAFLYASIIENKKSMMSVYNSYMKQIEKYAAFSMTSGKMDRYLAVIYYDIMSKSFITPEIAEKLPEIICTHMIKCDSSKIKTVTVMHKELAKSETVPVINKTAYVHVYTEEPVYIFEDIYGNRYTENVKYSDVKLLDMEEYLKMCYEISAQNIALSMHFADEFVRYRRNPSKSIGILQLLIQLDEVRGEYKRIIEKDIIDYYMDNYDGDSIDEYLKLVDVTYMEPELRNKVIELMIIRNNYERVLDIIREYGYMNIEPRRIMMFTSRTITAMDYEHDGLLVEMAAFSFFKGKYDEVILEYLSRYYYGTTKEMLKIWEAANDFAFQSRELEERLLAQMLFTGTYLGSIGKVYDSYYVKGPQDKLKKSYLISKSYDYFVHDKQVDDKVFEYIDRETTRGEDCPDICKLAYVRYYSGENNISDNVKTNARKIIEYLCAKNIIFEFYKVYKKYFPLPYMVEDKTILEYRTKPEAKVYVNYALETGSYEQRNFMVEEMRSVYPGVFTFEVVLFYGESLIYYISENSEDGNNIITESMSLNISDRLIGENSSRYGLLNDIMICQEMHEESTFIELAKNYDIQKKLTEELFKIM